jgi:hypothetical protein
MGCHVEDGQRGLGARGSEHQHAAGCLAERRYSSRASRLRHTEMTRHNVESSVLWTRKLSTDDTMGYSI